MNPVFYQYQREKNILDNLIQEFIKSNWLFDEMPNDYFHQYRWPDIVLSDKKSLLDWHDFNKHQKIDKEYPYTIELLGCYQLSTDRNKEGQVVLYMPKILETVLDFLNENGIDKLELPVYINRLTTIILLHEFTHWVFHAGTFKLSDKTERVIDAIKYNDEDSISYHETLAQIFTNFFCQQSYELSGLFIWLENKQPSVYRKYRALISDKEDDYINVSGYIIQRVIFSVMLIVEKPEYKKQSFNELKEIYTLFDKQDISGYFSNSNDFLKKYRGTITGKKFGV